MMTAGSAFDNRLSLGLRKMEQARNAGLDPATLRTAADFQAGKDPALDYAIGYLGAAEAGSRSGT
jgi:hypothetical protein